MSYKMSTNNGSMYHNWFYNAWCAANDSEFGQFSTRSFREVFTRDYGVEIDEHADYVTFPSEAEATLFVLRWA